MELSALPLIKDITILEELGKGNFGQVFKGTWKGSTVAMKILNEKSDYNSFVKECNILQ